MVIDQTVQVWLWLNLMICAGLIFDPKGLQGTNSTLYLNEHQVLEFFITKKSEIILRHFFDNFYAILLTIFLQSYMFRLFVKEFWAQDFWNYFQKLWYRNSVQCAPLHLPRTHVALRSLYFGAIRNPASFLFLCYFLIPPK